MTKLHHARGFVIKGIKKQAYFFFIMTVYDKRQTYVNWLVERVCICHRSVMTNRQKTSYDKPPYSYLIYIKRNNKKWPVECPQTMYDAL